MNIPEKTTKSDANFFYRGKTFSNEKDFFEYVLKYNDSFIDKESFNEIFEMMKSDLFLNIKMRDLKIKNGELTNILGDYFFLILERCSKEGK